MPSTFFLRTDTRYFAAALAENTTHSGIDTFEMSLGLATAGNKGERANQIVAFMFGESETDALVISMLNYLYVENPYADTTMRSQSYLNLKQYVLDRRGVEMTDNGFALPDGRDADALERVEREPAARPDSADATSNMAWSSATSSPSELARPVMRDSTKVFVVHGRDQRPVTVVRQFLQHLGLHMLTWSEAVALTGQTQPHTYDIVRAGMDGAAAIVVIFSPDDLARVKDDYSDVGDADRVPTGQPRQNVLLEAGLAFGIGRERTIFVKSASTRDISDIDGFNWVKLNGAYESRLDLKGRLARAGAAVRAGEYDLADPIAGPFAIAGGRA